MTTNNALTQSYDMAASRWRTKIEGLGYAAAYRWLIEQTQLHTHDANVLDAGCGTGDFTRALIEVAGPPKRVSLLDPSPEMVATAKRSLIYIAPNLRPLTASLQNAPVIAHDIVLCAHVIEHFTRPAEALDLLKAQLAPDGQLLLVVSKPHWCNWIIWVRWRHRMIKPKHMLQHIKTAGLRCTWDAGFPAGPPSRSSHAYLITHAVRTPS
jgi:2-polyprenyl-3-methyl-5-hydroxy-6-metoxy-1,4-benzoquinol methylase